MSRNFNRSVRRIFAGLILINLARPASGQEFISVPVALDAMSYSAAAWGDYDGDLDLDILLVGRNTSQFDSSLIYRKQGDSTFTNIFQNLSANDLAGNRLGSTIWSDPDGDGDLDVVITGEEGSRLYRNNGNETFTSLPGAIPDWDRSRAVGGDFTGDGRPDVVLLSSGLGTVPAVASLFINRGELTFEEHPGALPNPPGQATIAAADFDLDGDLDLLIAGSELFSGSTCLIYRNDGQGNFDPNYFGLPGFVSGTAAWGDMDNDGDPDLIIGGSGNSGNFLYLYRNDSFEFEEAGVQLPQLANPAAAWGDFDNDGWLDFVVAGGTVTPSTLLYHNQRNGTFTNVNVALPGMSLGSLTWADEDGDGRLDLLINGAGGYALSMVVLLRNQTVNANNPPGVPAGLSAITTAEGVTLEWLAATDANQAAGLTYNVRLGTTSGAHDIVPAMADTATGWRRIVAPGNAGTRHNLKVAGLPPGTYFWSVQAVDHAFAGGPFAAETSFAVQNLPTITGIEDVSLPLNGSTGPLDFTVADLETPAEDLLVVAESSNGTLVAPSGLVLGGAGANRTLSVTPAAGQAGTATITVTVSDLDGGQASTSFLVEVENQAPTISAIPPLLRAVVGSTPPSVPFTIGDLESPAESLTVTIVSSYPYLVPPDSWTLGGSGAERTLSLIPLPGVATGTDITITVTDPLGASTQASFVFEMYVMPPVITGLPPGELILYPGQSSPVIEFTVADDLTPAGEIIVVAETSDPNLINYNQVEIGGTGTSRSLLIHTLASLEGNAVITVKAIDADGGVGAVQLLVRIERFTEVSLGAFVPGNAGGSGWADTDGDGMVDLVLYDWGPPRVFRNTSSPGGGISFVPGPVMPDSIDWYSPAGDWADYDLDGDPDLLLAGVWSIDPGFALRIYRNDGGTFSLVDPGLPGVYEGWVSWGDFDRDGGPDVALSGRTQEGSTGPGIYLNRRDQGFELGSPQGSPETGPFAGYYMPELAGWGDFNNDGFVDFLGWVSSGFPGQPAGLRVLIHDGFFPKFLGEGMAIENAVVETVLILDMNGDGLLDMQLSGYRIDQSGRLWSAHGLNQGDGSFAFTIPNRQYHAVAQAWGDADNDGRLELLLAGSVYDGTTHHQQSFLGLIVDDVELPLPLTGSFSHFSWVDVDGDGDQDIYAVRNSQPVIYRNNIPLPNPPPATPAGLTFTHNDSPGLEWSPASDANQAGGLTYNLALRKADGTPVILPPADLVTGRLKLLKRGNAGAGLHWDLTGLPEGGYEWTVQSVDASHDASPFAPWQSFVVQPPPVISSFPDQSIRVNGTTGPLNFTVTDTLPDLPENLVVTVLSSDPLLVPPTGLVLFGAGVNRSLSVTPAADRIGVAEITVSVSDGLALTSTAFQLEVASDPPVLLAPDELTIHMNASSGLVALTLSDVDYAASNLVVEVSSSNLGLVDLTGITVAGTGASRSLAVTPNPYQIGELVLTMVTRNPAGLSSTNLMVVTVIDEPPVAVSSQIATDEDMPLLIALNASDPENEPLTVTITSPPAFGVLSGSGLTRTYQTSTNYFGPDAFTFQVNDGRHDSEPATVSITINPVPDTLSGLLVAQPVGNGQFLLELVAEPYGYYRIDVSPDLGDWEPWSSLQADQTGRISVLDAVPRPQRFYRITPVE